ncbi:hypothetical protein Q9295_09760 [Xinfangfangia sp. CPCC 101601]|uniref:Uncharacterized protein n=1 Tax=Pseudogemmobacter lacusdianii TaxID=3069608 RepID=A0ABU0VY37_9RHOB|nr:hypothetical protein [Xinfangfangia sp. CPCC 101601]MDQ2066661.1 hypothetical protein [Xinfangfangia sp. CPCC 101601]
MTKALAYLAGGAMAVLLASPSLACSPAPLTPSTTVERGEACSARSVVSEIDFAGLGEVSQLPGGFLLQETYEGNVCYGEASLIVMDCNTGKAALLGPQSFDLMQGGGQGQMEALVKDLSQAAAKGDLTLEVAAKAGAKRKLAQFASAKTKDRLTMMGRSFRLDCGCKTYYPELKPGG